MEANKFLGNRLKHLRGKRTQEEVANALGLSRARYSHYENDRVEPDNELLNRLADYFDTTIDYLLGRTDDPNSNESKDDFDPLAEINNLLKKYDIDQSGFFDIDKWKAMGPDEIRELESYFEFITSRAKERSKGDEENE